jgi:hypothetical protein
MFNNKYTKFLFAICPLAPDPKVGDLFNFSTCMISKSFIPLALAIATAVFTWGVVQYVINADNEEDRSKGKSFMIWGLIAFTVIVSIWGLVGILVNTFSLQSGAPVIQQ